jgi:Flp pilus assembly protein TadG
MRRCLARAMRDQRGLAGVEFAMLAPVLLLLLGCLSDFALAFWSKGVLASSVAEGAAYAFVAGPSVSASAIQSVVGQKLSLPAAAVTVTGPSCYCVSGTPATSASQACGNPCPNGSTPGTYVTISAQYTYTSLLPLYSHLASPVLVETTTARLK